MDSNPIIRHKIANASYKVTNGSKFLRGIVGIKFARG